MPTLSPLAASGNIGTRSAEDDRAPGSPECKPLPGQRAKPIWSYSLALASVVLAALVRIILQRWRLQASPFLVLTPAVMISAWYGGFGPGLLATLAGLFVADLYLVPPVGSFSIAAADVPRFVVFGLVGLQVSWLSGALRTAKHRAEAEAAEARAGQRLLSVAREQLQAANNQLETRVRQRTAELNLQKSLLEAQSNASIDGILAIAEDGSIIFHNRRLAEVWGVDPQVFDSTLLSATEAMSQKMMHAQTPLCPADSWNGQTDNDAPASLTLRDGRTLECYGAPIAGDDGTHHGQVWFFRDVTEARRLARQILEAAELERQRIGQDLHDDLCQHLTGIACLERVLQQRLESQNPNEAADAARLVDLIEQGIRRARDLAHGLQPVELSGGLQAALSELARRVQEMFGVQCHFRGNCNFIFQDPAAPMHLYHIAQEAINNAIRHGNAQNIHVELARDSKTIALTIHDDGVGLPPVLSSDGLGLRAMRHRARLIGARLSIGPTAGKGTILTCQLPGESAIDNEEGA